MKKSPAKQVLLLVAVLATAAIVSRFSRVRMAEDDLLECKTNLKNIGTAMEMYSTDWSGRYPSSFEKLTPDYLQGLPICPAAGAMSYLMEYGPESPHNEESFQDYYYLYCQGDNHRDLGLPSDYPCYDSISAPLER